MAYFFSFVVILFLLTILHIAAKVFLPVFLLPLIPFAKSIPPCFTKLKLLINSWGISQQFAAYLGPYLQDWGWAPSFGWLWNNYYVSRQQHYKWMWISITTDYSRSSYSSQTTASGKHSTTASNHTGNRSESMFSWNKSEDYKKCRCRRKTRKSVIRFRKPKWSPAFSTYLLKFQGDTFVFFPVIFLYLALSWETGISL